MLVTDAARKVRKPIRFSSTDLSCGGAFLRADVLFEVGEVLLIEFDCRAAPHSGPEPGRARRARHQKDKFPGMGLEFLDLSADDRAAIHARIS